MSDRGAKVAGDATRKVPVEILLSDTVFEAVETEGADQVVFLCSGKVVSKRKEAAHGPE